MTEDHLKSKEELLKKLQNARHKLAELQTMFPVVITSLDDGKVLSINSCASDFFGVSENDTINLTAQDYWYTPEDRSAFIEEVKKKGHVAEFEACLKTYTGEKRYVLLATKITTYKNQSASYTIITDITLRKKAEQALRKSRANYQTLYNLMKLMTDTAGDLIWAKDLSDCYIFANQTICDKLLMCEKNESPLGKKDLFFANRERQKGFRHSFGEICVNSDQVVKRSRRPERFLEDGFVRGKYLILDTHKTPLFDESGVLIGTVGVGRDVTEDVKIQDDLRKSAERYRLLADNVRDVIWTTDTEMNITYVTPSIKELTGYTADEFLNLPPAAHFTQRFSLDYNTVRRFLIKEAMKNRVPARYLWEFEWMHKDGRTIWVESSTSTIHRSDGTFEGFVCVARETTGKVFAQQELETAKDTALTASRAKSEFLANMSHEIRTPMNGVLGMLQLLNQTTLDPEQSRYVETALSSGTSLLKVISDILDFSKIEAGKIELEETHFTLSALIKSVLDSVGILVDRDRVALIMDIDDNIPSHIFADEARLRQILFNLLGNSVKFTRQGSISTTLSAEKQTDNSVKLLFEIHDTGIGISSQRTDSLFDPFVQADGSFRRKYSGTGLGLSIVRRLVELMGGTIAINSSMGEGTTVSFDILVQPSSPENVIQDKPEPNSSEQSNTLRILVVEDENINAMVVTAILEKMGHIPVLVNNGHKALEILKQEQFDCILMDIQMPEMDGIETARIIRQDPSDKWSNIPIIALTAHAMKGDRERFLAAGMNDYLTKPVEIEDLTQVLQQVRHGQL